jgi:hypothetical protein
VSPVGLQQRSNGGVSRTKLMHGGVSGINNTTSTRLVSAGATTSKITGVRGGVSGTYYYHYECTEESPASMI